MSTWTTWKRAFELLRLRDDGDDTEIAGCMVFDLDRKFPNYERFWQLHVVPATRRPETRFRFREFVDPIIERMGMTSHGIFGDLVTSEAALRAVRNRDYGDRYENCMRTLKSGGDAMQKFDDLDRNLVRKSLSPRLGRSLAAWTVAEWTAVWKPRYDKLIGYRNMLTHVNTTQIMVVNLPDGTADAFVPHENYFSEYTSLSWSGQGRRFETNQDEWDSFCAVCIRIHDATIAWLNDAYGALLQSLHPVVGDDDYLELFGWDTPKHGRHDVRHSLGSPGHQGPINMNARTG